VARWWVRLGGKTGIHVASPRFINTAFISKTGNFYIQYIFYLYPCQYHYIGKKKKKMDYFVFLFNFFKKMRFTPLCFSPLSATN
jgi:hypothetical protein